LCLLPLFLTGCFHKTQQAQVVPLAPPIVDTPPAQTRAIGPPICRLRLSPLLISPPSQPQTHNHCAGQNHRPRTGSLRPGIRSWLLNGSPGVSAIGQLSSGEPADLRQQTENSIAATDRGVNSITRSLSGQEKKTAAQIREFLKQARAALASGDADGASTLAAKAKVLLGENQPVTSRD